MCVCVCVGGGVHLCVCVFVCLRKREKTHTYAPIKRQHGIQIYLWYGMELVFALFNTNNKYKAQGSNAMQICTFHFMNQMTTDALHEILRRICGFLSVG